MKRIIISVAGRVLACLALIVPSAVRAEQPITLDEAVRLAVERQPLLRSLESAAVSAREAAVAEAQLPDPKLRLGVLNLPAAGADAFRLNRDDQTMTTVSLMQDVVRPEKREASARLMRAEADRWESEQGVTAQTIRRDAALAWLDAYETLRRAEVYRRMADEISAERKVAASQLSSGGAGAGELFRLDTMLAMTNDKRLAAQRDERRARAALARWIGEAAARPLPSALPDAMPAADRGKQRALLERNPLLENARRVEALAHSDADRAKAGRLEDWSWELMYGKRQGDRSDMLTFQVSFDLPWDRANRQDRRVAEKLALVERARELAEDRRRELSSELDSARADWEAAEAREREHVAHLIPAAQASLAIAQANYSAGKAPLAAVWEARRGLLEVELEHWTIQVDRQRAAVRLAYLLNNPEDKP